MDSRYHLDIHELYPLKNINIIQIGRMHCKPETVVKTHQHLDWYELTIVTEGSGTVYTGEIPTAVSRGDIYFSYPCDAHAITSDAENPLKFDFFSFQAKDPSLIKTLEAAVEQRPGADKRLIRDDRIASLVSNAIAEFCSLEKDSTPLLEAIFHQLITYLLRDLASLVPDKPPTHFSAAETLCFRLMNYIDTHLYSLENLNELAEITGYHYSHLSGLFHKTTGTTLFGYCQSKRLEAARVMLRDEKRSIREVADILGYSTAYAFSKAYRKHYGVSPGSERKSCKE